MKVRTKRLVAALLLVCMLLSVMPAVSLAADAETVTETVNYGFDVLTKYADCVNLAKKSYFNKATDASGNQVYDAEGNEVRVRAYLADLYAIGIMNFVLESYYSQNEAEGDEYKNFEIRADQGHRLKASNAGDWVAFRLRNPGAGIADITLTTSGTNSMNAVNIYLIKAEENLDIESNMTAANLMVSDLSVSGEYVIAEGKTLESSDYILVIEHSKINSSKYFCLTDLNIAVTKQAEPEAPEVVAGDQTYGFDVLTQYAECAKLEKKSYFNKALDASGNQVYDAEGNEVRVRAYLADLYAKGIMNFVLESYYSQNEAEGDEYKNFEIRADQGHRLKASNAGDWVAFRLRNPGAGKYNISLTANGTSSMNEVDVYLIKAEENLDIESKIIDANLLAAGLAAAGEYKIGKEVELESSDYILVINHTQINSSKYFCLTNLAMTLCKEPEVGKTMGYNLDLADPETGIYTGDDILLADMLEDINARYKEGTLSWTLAGVSSGLAGTTAATAHLPSESVAFQQNNGLRVAGIEGEWMALRIKSPGSGDYAISLNYAMSENTGTVAMYILPADTADIGAAMDPTNRLGKVNMNSADGDVGVVDGYSSVVGNYTFGDAQEYIVVLECYSDSVNTAGKCFMYISELVMKEGKYEDSTESTKNVQSVTVLKNAVNDGVIDPGVFSAIREVNGHDYYFLPCEGSIMLIFDLTTGEFIRQVETGINYPRDMGVAPDGKIWLCGSNKFFFVYDPDTNTSFKTADFRVLGIPGLEAEGGIACLTITDEGIVYFGTYYNGCLVKYDPIAKEFTNLGAIVPGTKTLRVQKYRDGYVYFTAETDDSAKFGKYNLKTNQIEKIVDITDLKGTKVYGANFLGDDLIIVGGNRMNGIIALNSETFEFVDTGLPNTGVNLQVTEEIDGKHYLVVQGYGLYSYDIATKTFKDEGFGTSGIGFRTGGQNSYGKSIVTLNGDPCLFTYTATGGHPRIWNLKTREFYPWDDLVVGNFGAGAKLRSFLNGAAGSNEILMGAFNTEGITVYNTELGTVTYRSKTTGQTDSLIWYEGVLYAGNYSNCVIASCDPTDPSAAKVLYKIGNKQKRVHTLTAGDGYVFAGTTPDANLFGGGIAMYNVKTGEGTFHRNVIQDQSINKLVYHDGLLYGSSSTEGGSGAGNAPGTSAVLFVYDYKNGTVLATCDLREHIDGLGDPIDFIAGIEADPNVAENGRFWGVVSETLFCFTFDKTTNTFQVQEVLSFDKTTYNEGGSRHWFARPIVFNKELNQIYVSFDNDGGMQCIEIADWNASVGNVNVAKNTRIMGDTPMFYVLGEDGNLYYASNYDLMMLPLNVSDKDWAVAGAVDAMIDAIGSNITVDSETAVEAARAAYKNLSMYYQALVQELSTLEEAEADLLEAKIDTISDVTADSLPALREMMDEYGAMNERQQRYVKNYATLQAAYDLAGKLSAEAEAANKAVADDVIAKIEAIGSVTLESEEAIKAARAAYDALTDAQKALVDTAKLTAAEAKLAELKAAAEKEAADKAAAEAVIKQIDAIGTVTLDSKAAIEAARAAYDALTAEQKALVDAAKLTAAEAKLAELKAAAEKEAADKAAADAVIAKINAIGKVTAESGDAIAAARKAYNALTDDQKALITNLDVLTDAEAAYEDAIKDPGSPDTGDNAPVMLLACVALISMMAIVAIPVMRKKG